jgi:O-antigen/teichoic acid export membrane protein
VCIAAGVGVMLVADNLVVTVFGENWRGAVPFFRWLAIFGVFAALGRPLMPLFYMLKREKLYASLSFAQVVATFAAVVFAALHINLVAVAAARTLVAGCFCVIFAAYATRIAPLRPIDFAGALWRPSVAAAAMTLAVRALQTIPAPLAIVGLFRDAAVGAVVFSATAWVLWIVCGRPEGAERVILSSIRDKLARRTEPVTA